MIKSLRILPLLLLSTGLYAQSLISATKIRRYTTTELALQGIFNTTYEVDLYKIVYNTVDVMGNPTIASGALTVPVISDCDTFPLLNYNHGTVLLKSSVPSQSGGEEFVGLASSTAGVIATMPDYLGLGDGPGLHPYQHAESEATATLDMIRACRGYITDSLSLILNGQVFLTGYSQGGHAAMATHKYIQENNLYSEFNVIASAPASGAYDMSGTTADYVFSNAYSNPGYIVYLIEAYQLAYGDLYTTKDQYYKSPYDQVILPYLTGDSTMASLNAVLPAFVDSLLEDSVLANYLADSLTFSHPLRRALRDNDVYDWSPNVKVEMSYCENDEQVPFQNSVKTESVMKGNGATDVKAVSRGAFFNHGQCVIPSLTSVQSLVNGLAYNCRTETGIISKNTENKFSIYPVPANNFLTIEVLQISPNTQMQIMDARGSMLGGISLKSGKNTFDISKFNPGIYLLRFIDESEVSIKQIVIQ